MRRRTRTGGWRRSVCLALVCGPLLAGLGDADLAGPFAPDHPLEVGMTEHQRIALEAIAAQPVDLHPDILTVVSDVPTLLRIAALWQDFELALLPITSEYDTQEQAALQDLLRHPGLLETLVDVGARGEPALRAALDAYPESIREVALAAGLGHRRLLAQVKVQRDAAVRAFEALIAPQPEATRDVYRRLVGHPELIGELIEQLDTTEMLAGSARVDLPGTLLGLESLHARVLRGRAEAEAERARRAEAKRRAAEAEAARQRARRAERLDRNRYWGASPCWYGASRWAWDVGPRCWYPWHGYARRWW